MDAGIIAVVGLVGGAIGWFSSQYWHHRQARRQAALDAGETLDQKKKLFEEMLSNEEDADRKQVLRNQLDDVNHAFLGLRTERVRRLLREAGLPDEETLVTRGREQLSPEQATNLEEAAAEVAALPISLSKQDLLSMGNAYYYAGEYEEAFAAYNRSLELRPDDPGTLMNRGVTYDEMGKYEEALADYNRSLELRPDHPDTLTNRGVTYDEMGKYEEALADHNRSLELRPDDPTTLMNRGVTYGYLGKYEESLADLNRSLELRPDDSATLMNRGTAYGYLDRYEESLADLNRSLELRPDHPDTLYNLACLFSLRGKADEALGYLEKAIAGDEKYREKARTDDDFNNIREDPRFKKLVEPD